MHNTQLKKRAGLSALALALSWATGAVVLTTAATPAYAETYQDSAQANAVYYSEAELDRLLAPVALYPDSLLTHILIAATYPLEVVQAERWAQKHKHLQPEQALELATEQPWDDSVKALVGTPDVLKQMSEDLTWTQAIGEAFLAQQEDVLDRVQTLRQHAYDAGNLKSNKHVSVERAERTIVIENVRREVVYVPYYDTRVVYGSWWWHNHPPVYWSRPSLTVSIGSGIYWGISYNVPSRFYFSHFFWPQRYVVINHHYYTAPPKKRRDYYMTRHDGKRWNHNPRHRRGVEYRHRDLQPRQPKYHMVQGEVVQPVLSARGVNRDAPVPNMRIEDPKPRPKFASVKRELREPAVRMKQPQRSIKPIDKRVVQQPQVERPRIEKPRTQPPRIERPVVRQPETRLPVVRQPDIRTPDVRKPEIRNLGVRKPEARNPVVRQPEVVRPSPRPSQVRQPQVRQPQVRQPQVAKPVQRAAPVISRPSRNQNSVTPVRGHNRDH
ncbi:DUF3300 domain-containing protein [Pseudidiomarina donghaiensis]|uniref:DUF3300 domain-containing protein n=1 Tax=Pseudidiomarina donghaiensis TaxID=519452 RepID=UPI003A96B524